MIKYIKYYISTFILIIAIFFCTLGIYYPLLFLILFSLMVILGDGLLPLDLTVKKYSYPNLLNLPIYINLFILILFLSTVIFILGNNDSNWFSTYFFTFTNIDLIYIKKSISIFDKVSLIGISSLFIGIMATVPGHELTHRKRSRFDMFFGNWLLSLSWDCAFAIEHVYGHHKNVCLKIDPASAKRGENIYKFIFFSIIKEQKDAWVIELDHLNRRKFSKYSIKNRMLIGYLRSLLVSLSAYFIGGLSGLLYYLLCAFIAKSLLEVINFIEHYGLVREQGAPVYPRHSWNSNHAISSILLYNVNRHSSHHEKSNLKYWELEPYVDSPVTPYGYLLMLYIALFVPFFFHKIMAKKLIHWDKNFANNQELELAIEQNNKSGINLLLDSIK